jgi:hypothetical protein
VDYGLEPDVDVDLALPFWDEITISISASVLLAEKISTSFGEINSARLEIHPRTWVF